MFFVFIYEENEHRKHLLTECVREYIIVTESDMEIAISTGNSSEIIAAIQLHRARGLYFLSSSEQGAKAAAIISQYDTNGAIIGIGHGAWHSEKKSGTIETESDERLFRKNVYAFLKKNYENYISDENLYRFKTRGNGHSSCAYDEILFFETDPTNSRWIILHTKIKKYTLVGTLNNISQELGDSFFRCHKSFVINLDNIPEEELSGIERNKGIIVMQEGAECHVSVRKSRELLKKLSVSSVQQRPVSELFPILPFLDTEKKSFFIPIIGVFFLICIVLAFTTGFLLNRNENRNENTPEITPEISEPENTSAINIPMSAASIRIPANEAMYLSLETTQSSVIIEPHQGDYIRIQSTSENLPPYTLANNNLQITDTDASVIIISIPQNTEPIFNTIHVRMENGNIQIRGASALATQELEMSVMFGSIIISNISATKRLDLQTHHGNIYLENVNAPPDNFIYNANRGYIITR
ncbi:MAG: LytTR family transcriptional regulator DNA-binding domain-containing protein [Defluviitaleaceae bacterium]|nr:LytTR family transcriptional regulator DNA-binding domain-containing protein [Defluviitaleaceae bacterium]